MLYMVIEKYRHGPGPVYQRAAERGRMLPDGLRYLDSWVVDDGGLDRCFQLMETDDPALLAIWQQQWADLTEFEIVPVIKSAEAAGRVDVRWEGRPATDELAGRAASVPEDVNIISWRHYDRHRPTACRRCRDLAA
jgi:uncharacterized protein DUF3303